MRGALIVNEVDGEPPVVAGSEGGLDLDAEEASGFAEDEIKRLAVAEGFADREAHLSGFEGKDQLGEFSFALGEWRRRSLGADGRAGLGDVGLVFHGEINKCGPQVSGHSLSEDFEQ